MDPVLASIFTKRLLPGERLLWVGRPAPGLRLTGRDAFLIPFSLLWCGFAIFWEASVLRMHAPWFFVLWGLPFVIIGLFAAVGRFFLDAAVRRGSSYALTDRRLLLDRAGLFAGFATLGATQLAQARLTERADGRGTISFGADLPFSRGGLGGLSAWLPSLGSPPALIGIPDARALFDEIQRVATQAR